MRKLILMLVLLLLMAGNAVAQVMRTSGQVLSQDDGLPIIGATVRIQGSDIATATDADGRFSLSGFKTSNKYLEAVVRLIGHFFPDIDWAVVSGHKDGVPTKPDPSVVFEILTVVPTPKLQVLYVGDSGVDIETARRACIESVGVTWGFRPVSELKAFYADHIVSSPDAILALTEKDINI